MRYLMYKPAMPDTSNHASTRRQARTDGAGREKESSVLERCSLESVCGQACVYRHIAGCVFTTIFINYYYKYQTRPFLYPYYPYTHNIAILISILSLHTQYSYSYIHTIPTHTI